MEKKLIKLMLDWDFWQENKHKISPTMFPPPLDSIYRAIKQGHEQYNRSLKLDEIRAVHRITNPTLTRAARNAVEELFIDVDKEELIGFDLAKNVLSHMWRCEVGKQIADKAIALYEGKSSSLREIQSIIDGVQDDFTPVDDVKPVTDDVEELVKLFDKRHSWQFNIETVASKIPGISGGEFTIIFGRPEQGKSAAAISLCAGPKGFCDQGALVHVICNEEPAIRTQLRAISCFTGMTREEIFKDVTKAKELYKPIRGRLKFIDDVTMSLDRLDGHVRKNRPDILVVDQLDKIKMQGNYEQSHEMLRSLYTGTREICKKYDASGIGVCQASADGQDKTFLHYSCMEGSKTGKAAEADIVIGVGANLKPSGDSGEEDMTRVWYLSKNKISGNHGACVTVLNKSLSRYEC